MSYRAKGREAPPKPVMPELPGVVRATESKKLTKAEFNALGPKIKEWVLNLEDCSPELSADEIRELIKKWKTYEQN